MGINRCQSDDGSLVWFGCGETSDTHGNVRSILNAQNARRSIQHNFPVVASSRCDCTLRHQPATRQYTALFE